MGRYLTPGHSYNDGDTITGPSLTEHVSESTFKPTAITEQTLKTPAALTDQLLVVSSGAFFQETLQQIHDLILYPGSIIQSAYQEYTANTNLSVEIPSDDTIPQNTEGTEIINLSITPRFLTSVIKLSFFGTMGSVPPDPSPGHSAALFRGTNINAITSVLNWPTNADYPMTMTMVYQDSPATTSAITYSVRVGPASPGTVRMNGWSYARVHGGAMRSVLIAEEIKQ